MPFQRKLTPAALPTRTTNSRVAWNVELAGAMRVSCATSCPSEVTETQAFSVARITNVKFSDDDIAGFGVGAPKERIVTSPFFSTVTWFALVTGGAADGGAGLVVAPDGWVAARGFGGADVAIMGLATGWDEDGAALATAGVPAEAGVTTVGTAGAAAFAALALEREWRIQRIPAARMTMTAR